MALKSLAHPDWPYAGTAHEWRGFVKKSAAVMAEPVPELIAISVEDMEAFNAVYQKQNSSNRNRW
jgi:hypothetical protein